MCVFTFTVWYSVVTADDVTGHSFCQYFGFWIFHSGSLICFPYRDDDDVTEFKIELNTAYFLVDCTAVIIGHLWVPEVPCHRRGIVCLHLLFRDITVHIRTRDEDIEITLQWSWSGLYSQFSINIYDVFYMVSKVPVPHFCDWIT